MANPAWREVSSLPRTLVRKTAVPDAAAHGDVARWPHSFRPDDYDWASRSPAPPAGEDTLTMTSRDLIPATQPGQDLPALRLADVLELLTRDIADLD